jgi:hypothetical protein
MRAKDRSEILEPKVKKSRTLHEDPSAEMPKSEHTDPSRE